MPRIPGIGPDFLKRIKDQTLERIDERIKRELAPSFPEAPGQEQVPQGLGQRIKERVKEQVSRLSPVQRRLLDPNSPLDEPTIRYRIKYAGENQVLLYMKYNNEWRHVEAYSYRKRGKNGEWLFFGFCRIHNKIHAFRLDRIQGLVLTQETYRPQWVIEVA